MFSSNLEMNPFGVFKSKKELNDNIEFRSFSLTDLMTSHEVKNKLRPRLL